MMQTLSEVLRGSRRDGETLSAEIRTEWLQGRSVYGGLQAALAVEAMQAFSDGLPIRTLQATLCAPVPAGTLRLRAQMLRQGGNTRQVEARIVDGETTLALFVGIFGRGRESRVAHDLMRPELPEDGGTPMRHVPGLTPDFIQQFDATLLRGHFPGAGRPDTGHVFSLGLKDEAPATGLPQLLALSDFPPPMGLSWLESFRPASTMTWMLNFIGHEFRDQPLDGWIIDVALDAARDGYTQQSVTVFAPDGFAVARGTQCMVVFG